MNRGQELKFFDADIHDTTIASTLTVTLDSFNKVAAGTGPSDRIGRRIFIKSIDLKWNIVIKSDTVGRDEVRVLIFCDKQANGAVAVGTDILDDQADHPWLTFRNLEHTRRFTILMDKRISIASMASGASGVTLGNTKHYKLHYKFPKGGLAVDFESTTGAMSEISSNNIGMMAISSSALTEMHMQSRIRYYG